MVHRHNEYQAPVLDDSQHETLVAIMDAMFQGHTGDEAAGIKARLPKGCPEWQIAAVDDFIEKSFSQIPGAIDNLLMVFGRALSPSVSAELLTALTILATTPGTMLLTGGYIRPFSKLSIKEREAVLQSWLTSALPMRRKIVRAFASMGLYVIYGCSPIAIDAIGYPSPARRLLSKPLKAPSYTYTFINPPPATSSSLPTVYTDILVIGSGAGGGVVASRLAPSHKLLVIDKGIYAPTGEKSRGEAEGFNDLYQNGGFIGSESGSISVLAASVFGGGTAINWSGSLKTQHYVREEWARKKGLDWFLSDGYTQALDAVCERMGVSHEHIKQNKSNSKLLEGCRKLGYHADPIPQNTSGEEHSCGFCSFGCPYGEKQGTVETFMVDAAKHGTEFMSRTQVDRLLFSKPMDIAPEVTSSNIKSYTPSAERTRCFGAQVTLDNGSQAILIARKAVVVSSGSINSPAILMRSGLDNPNIGKNLHLHPCTYVTGAFEDKVNPWDGSIMTAISNVCENRDGTHHGAKLEVCMSFPGGIGGGQESWRSSADHKARMLEYNHCMTLITLVRDRDSGQIVLDAKGQPRIKYDISQYDSESANRAVIAGAEILLAAGAKRVSTTQAGVPSYEPELGHKGLVDPKWVKWVETVKKAGALPGWTTYGSAHQMGTCQMGTTPATSVIDPRGKVWGTDNLFVADASVFPSASGVNPMISTMACAYSIAGFMLEDLSSSEREGAQRSHLD